MFKSLLLLLLILNSYSSSENSFQEFEKYSKGRIVYYSSLSDIHSIYKSERNMVFASGLLMGGALSLMCFCALMSCDLIEFKYPS